MYRVQCAWLVAIGEIHAVLSAGPARLPRAEGRTGQGGMQVTSHGHAVSANRVKSIVQVSHVGVHIGVTATGADIYCIDRSTFSTVITTRDLCSMLIRFIDRGKSMRDVLVPGGQLNILQQAQDLNIPNLVAKRKVGSTTLSIMHMTADVHWGRWCD